MALTVPVMADSVTTQAEVGVGGSTAPYMIALWTTPDETPGDTQVDVYPENVIPNAAAPLFPPDESDRDGYKLVKFYLMADHETLGHDAITGVTVDVFYPGATREEPGDLKFEINAIKLGPGCWEASQSAYATVYYPAAPGQTAVQAIVPQPQVDWTVRELVYTDYVDVDADEVIPSAADQQVQNYLNSAGARVVYGYNKDVAGPWTAATAGARLQSDQALLIELSGWIWFHQDPLEYIVEGSATKGVQSDPLMNWFTFVAEESLYLDFDSVNYGNFNADVGRVVRQGDTDLGTPLAPTIWDNGNIDAMVYIDADEMIKDGNPEFAGNPGKTITDFDAALYYKDEAGNNVQVGYITFTAADGPVLIENDMMDTVPVQEMGPDGAVLLQACHPAKLDLSIEPNDYIDSGSYVGDITITIAPYCQYPSP
jgi:hypothetical protein